MASIRKTAAEEDEDYENVLKRFNDEDYLNWPNEAGVSLSHQRFWICLHNADPFPV